MLSGELGLVMVFVVVVSMVMMVKMLVFGDVMGGYSKVVCESYCFCVLFVGLVLFGGFG